MSERATVEVCQCGHPRFDHASIQSDDFAGACFEGEEDWWCACLRYTPARCQCGHARLLHDSDTHECCGHAGDADSQYCRCPRYVEGEWDASVSADE